MRKVLSLVFVCVLCVGSVFGQQPFVPGSDVLNNEQAFNAAMAAAEAEGSSSGNEGVCPGDDKQYIILNTNVPFVGRCIKKEFNVQSGESNVSNVFPRLMGYMIRIMMTVLVVGGFLGILVGGFMIASNGAFGTKQTGVKLILGVIAGLILLGASGILLNLINPNFFGTAS